MYLTHQARAVATGARLIHSCGFDSVPHDLGAQFTVEQLPEGAPLRVRGYVRAKGTVSGGHDGLGAGRAVPAPGRPYGPRHPSPGQPAPEGRRVRVVPGRPGRSPETGWWVLPMPTIDPQVVAELARQLPRYGPDFSYTHYWAGESPLTAAGVALGAGALVAVAQVGQARRAVERLRPSGSGPTAGQRAAAWFRVRFVGEGGGTRVVTEVAGGDPGYTETATMISETALSLVADDLPDTAGQVTTASALGPVLRTRLEAAGITFTVLD